MQKQPPERNRSVPREGEKVKGSDASSQAEVAMKASDSSGPALSSSSSISSDTTDFPQTSTFAAGGGGGNGDIRKPIGPTLSEPDAFVRSREKKALAKTMTDPSKIENSRKSRRISRSSSFFKRLLKGRGPGPEPGPQPPQRCHGGVVTGYLSMQKKKGLRKSWVTHYCQMKEGKGMMLCFRETTDTKPVDVITLCGASVQETDRAKQHFFRITPAVANSKGDNKSILFMANLLRDRQRWVSELIKEINRQQKSMEHPGPRSSLSEDDDVYFSASEISRLKNSCDLTEDDDNIDADKPNDDGYINPKHVPGPGPRKKIEIPLIPGSYIEFTSEKNPSSDLAATNHYKGWLLKKGGWGAWTKRFFKVHNGRFVEYRNETSPSPERSISLVDCTVEELTMETRHGYVFKVTPLHEYKYVYDACSDRAVSIILAARTKDEQKAWMSAFEVKKESELPSRGDSPSED